MNPHIALRFAEQHQSRLRGEAPRGAPVLWSGRDAKQVAMDSAKRVRRAAGWALVEIGLRIAVTRDSTSVVSGR